MRSDAVGSARALERRYLNRIIPVLMFLALLSLYGLQLWHHATRASTTIDEPFHIVAGYRYWQCGDYAINPEHPPFLKLLATHVFPESYVYGLADVISQRQRLYLLGNV